MIDFSGPENVQKLFALRRSDRVLLKIALSAMFAAVAVTLSGFSFPVGPSRCFPFQHAVNAIAGILLGPWWAAGAAIVSSTIRNFLGTGTILAYPGSVFGAMAVGFLADALPVRFKPLAAVAEPLATATVGAWVSALIMAGAGKSAMFGMLSAAFLASSAPGALIGFLLLCTVVAYRRRARISQEKPGR